MSKPRIIIEVRSGLVDQVYSAEPLDVEVIDHDNARQGALDDDQIEHYRALCKEKDAMHMKPQL